MMNIEEFFLLFDDFSTWNPRKQIDYICYYFTAVAGKKSVTSADVKESLQKLDLKVYSRTPQYLSENASDSKKGRYIRYGNGGYRLERSIFDEISLAVKNEPAKIQVSAQLVDLIPKIKNSNENSFLIEALNCYKVGAYRAAILLIWILTIDHLQNFIFGNKIDDFNTALGLNPDKKMSKIVNLDDFGELKESKFIELTKSAGIISNDVRKILDEKLGIRNSAAHPSGITFTGHKATEFALDLINNILLKF